MAVQRRSFNSLPSYLQTDRNNLELAVTDDLVYEPEQAKFVSGFIGDTSKLTQEDLARTPVIVEDNITRQKYQFSVAIAQRDPIKETFVSGAFYDDLINHLFLNGAIIDDPNRIFSAFYYSWSPPIDYDKLVNPARYYWTGAGNADVNGEYITKEAAGSVISLYKFNGTILVQHPVVVVNGLPGSGNIGDLVEDASTTNRLIYEWNGVGWGEVVFLIASDTKDTGAYFTNDWVYVCRTGPLFNRPVMWVYRTEVGRWVSQPVVVSIDAPDSPIKNMIWEDASVPPARIFRIYDGNQWQNLSYGPGAPSGVPGSLAYLYDTRGGDDVDSWSAQNWWRCLEDLSVSDRSNLGTRTQGSRPIIEFWGNIEAASGDTRVVRNQPPLFNLYAVAVADSSYQIEIVNPTNFPGLNDGELTDIGNYVDNTAVTRIFKYAIGTGPVDPILGIRVIYGSDGTPEFLLELEQLPVTVAEGNLLGYRYYRDTATGFVHSIWERTSEKLTQAVDSNGLYEIPKGLKNNPDHVVTTDVSRATYINHFGSVIRSQADFTGTPYGTNSYRWSAKDLTLGATMIDPEESLLRTMAVLQTNTLDIPDAIRQMSREYNKVMARFVSQLNTYWNTGVISNPDDTLITTTSATCDIILTQIFSGRNSEFPFFYSTMGTYTETRMVSGTPFVFENTPQPIYIPMSGAQIGASPAYEPQIFTDTDGVKKIRGHDGSLIVAFNDPRDDILIDLETRFFNSVPDYLKTETDTFSSRFNSVFHLDNYYGGFVPTDTAGVVVDVVDDYTAIGSPVAQQRIFSKNQQVYAIWNGTAWMTQGANVNDVFFNQADTSYYIFNGFYTNPIPTWNNGSAAFDYTFNEFRQIVQREFERYVVLHNLDFITNNSFDQDDPFTWNFSSAGIEGNYRGIYRRIYRTVRPHSHPWEAVGYSVMPSWWTTQYTPTSTAADGTPRYASSHQMWTDFHAGIVNPIDNTVVEEYRMMAPTPVDIDGELLDPIAAGVVDVQALAIAGLADDWAYGDGSPGEETFYNSYYFQFAIALAGYLMKNPMFVERTWSEFYREIGMTGDNRLWNAPANVATNTLTRPQAKNDPSHLSLDDANNIVVNPGLNAWIAEYTAIIGKSPDINFNDAIINAQAVLGWKTAGFINAKRTRVELLSGDEIPNEDLAVVLHQGPSINEFYQSGIIIVRDIDGFRVYGTDVLNPYFRVELGAKPVKGGQVELTQDFNYDGFNRSFTITQFTIPSGTNDTASFGVLINGYKINPKFIIITSATTFTIDQSLMMTKHDVVRASVVTTVSNPSTQVGSFVVNGVQITYFQSGTGVFVNYPYGSLFESFNDVVNMMVGHGRWLSSQGWIFERITNGVLRDWLGAAKTFAAWATEISQKFRGNAQRMKGQTFEYSVLGRQTQFRSNFGMILGIEDIRNGSYGVVDVDTKPVRGVNLNVVSDGGTITVSSDSTDIYGLRLYVSEVQHAVFFPNTTTFNDVIYEPALGLAQDAVFVDTYRSTNWNGRLEAPGFLILNGQLLANWEKQTNDITRYYDRFNPPDDPILVGMSRNLFGYAPKNYMDMLTADDRTQFNFFRGTLKAKGTFQPYKAFVRGTTIGSDNVTIAEDWAWKFARYGDARVVKVLFNVDEADFVDIYQAIHFDELTFTYNFTGDERTTCFIVPQRFAPDEIVVIVGGTLTALGLDYKINPVDNGQEVCFNIAPLHNQTIIIQMNEGLVHAEKQLYWSSQGGPLDTHMVIRAANTFIFVNGRLDVTVPVYPDLPIISVQPGTYVHAFGNVGAGIFLRRSYSGDGYNNRFASGCASQTTHTLFVTKNGFWQRPGIDYGLDASDAQNTIVVMSSTPALNDAITVVGTRIAANIRSRQGVFSGNGSQTAFTVSGITLTSYRQVIVSVNGAVQVGDIPGQSTPYTYRIVNGSVRFNIPPVAGAQIVVFVVLDAVSLPVPELEDDRVIHIPQFSPPNNDTRWVIPPPQDIYRDLPFRFPINQAGEVDVNKYVFSGALVDQTAKSPAVHMFHWNPAKDLHEPFALGLVDFKTPYDPARYNSGPLTESLNGLIWTETREGTVWWDTSTSIYADYTGFLPDYMQVTREWGKLFYYNATITLQDEFATVTTLDPKTRTIINHNLVTGQVITISGADQPEYNGTVVVNVTSSSTFNFVVYTQVDSPGTGDIQVQVGMVNVYEWVASPVPPGSWDAYVTSQNGFDTYTGVVRNATNPSFSTQEVWDTNGNSTITYYFWVETNTRIIPSKGLCVRDIAGRLKNPAQYEVPFLAIMDESSMFCFAGDDIVQNNSAVEVSYEWYEMPRHIEWMLIGENDDFTQIPELVTDKLLDSMLGQDIRNNAVPNQTLAPIDQLGTCYFPQQSVFTDSNIAINIYVDAVNAFLDNIDIDTIPTVFDLLDLSTETANDPSGGFWTRETFWAKGVDHSVIYEVVRDTDERDYRTAQGFYFTGDIIQVDETDQIDLWDSAQMLAYYQYDGSAWTLVGIQNHTAHINAQIAVDHTRFRNFFTVLMAAIDLIDGNKIIFSMLFEMLRQNPVCDWFFKTSYIDPHITLALPVTNYVRPDQATAVFDAILDLKPYRTKLRDTRVTYNLGEDQVDNIGVTLSETQLDKVTLIFDRVACDLTDENSWDTIPWDATVTYPESNSLTIEFIGNGTQRCFSIPEIAPPEDVVVLLNGRLAIPDVDYRMDTINYEVCFTVAPIALVAITVMIDSIYEYFTDFEYAFQGNGSIDSQIVPDAVSETTDRDVITAWNGVYQVPATDFTIQVTSDTEIVYTDTPNTEYVVGTVFGGVINDVWTILTFTSNGSTVQYNTGIEGQDNGTVIVIVDGVWQTVNSSYQVDTSTNPSTSFVDFFVAPQSGSKIVIYAATYPKLTAARTILAIGDGFTRNYAVSDLDPQIPAKIFVHLDGIEQSHEHGDYSVSDSGVIFMIPPGSGVSVVIFAVWTGLGTRLQAVPSPATIQWDWAFWDYADLGRQEFDFAGVFFGDGTTTGFSVPIPQTTSSLYNVVLKFFQNGVAKTPAQLGITVTITKVSTAVNVFLNHPIDTHTYCAIYVSRGFVEGLNPTFGYQNPQGIIFEPVPASYQHFFARMISKTFDPSTIMTGCPTPQERIDTTIDDMFTVIVRTIPETLYENPLTYLNGVAVAARVGHFAFNITSTPDIISTVEAIAVVGHFGISYDAPNFHMTGVSTTTGIPSFEIIVDPWWPAVATAEYGSFTFDITTNLGLTGVQAQTQLTIIPTAPVPGIGQEVAAEIGQLLFELSSSTPGFGVGFFGTGGFGLNQTTAYVTAQTGSFIISIASQVVVSGLEVQAEAGSLAPQTPDLETLAVTAHTGTFIIDSDSAYQLVVNNGFGMGDFGDGQFGAAAAIYATAEINDRFMGIEPGITGAAAIASVGTLAYTFGITGVEAVTAIAPFILTHTQPVIISGVEAVSVAAPLIPAYPVLGLNVTAAVGNIAILIEAFESGYGSGTFGTGYFGSYNGFSAEVVAQVGSLVNTYGRNLAGLEVTAIFDAQPIRVAPLLRGLEVFAYTGHREVVDLGSSGQHATAQFGVLTPMLYADTTGYGGGHFGEGLYGGGFNLEVRAQVGTFLYDVVVGDPFIFFSGGAQSASAVTVAHGTVNPPDAGAVASTAIGAMVVDIV